MPVALRIRIEEVVKVHLNGERVFADQAQSLIRASTAPNFLENLSGERAGPVAGTVADQARVGLNPDDGSRVGGLHGLDGRDLDLVPRRGGQRLKLGKRGADGHCHGGLEKISSCDIHNPPSRYIASATGWPAACLTRAMASAIPPHKPAFSWSAELSMRTLSTGNSRTRSRTSRFTVSISNGPTSLVTSPPKTTSSGWSTVMTLATPIPSMRAARTNSSRTDESPAAAACVMRRGVTRSALPSTMSYRRGA